VYVNKKVEFVCCITVDRYFFAKKCIIYYIDLIINNGMASLKKKKKASQFSPVKRKTVNIYPRLHNNITKYGKGSIANYLQTANLALK